MLFRAPDGSLDTDMQPCLSFSFEGIPDLRADVCGLLCEPPTVARGAAQGIGVQRTAPRAGGYPRAASYPTWASASHARPACGALDQHAEQGPWSRVLLGPACWPAAPSHLEGPWLPRRGPGAEDGLRSCPPRAHPHLQPGRMPRATAGPAGPPAPCAPGTPLGGVPPPKGSPAGARCPPCGPQSPGAGGSLCVRTGPGGGCCPTNSEATARPVLLRRPGGYQSEEIGVAAVRGCWRTRHRRPWGPPAPRNGDQGERGSMATASAEKKPDPWGKGHWASGEKKPLWGCVGADQRGRALWDERVSGGLKGCRGL